MDHNKRTALLTAIDLGNLTRAAEQLGYTQSGLSYIIKSVEAEFGFPLLIRSRSGVRPDSSSSCSPSAGRVTRAEGSGLLAVMIMVSGAASSVWPATGSVEPLSDGSAWLPPL